MLPTLSIILIVGAAFIAGTVAVLNWPAKAIVGVCVAVILVALGLLLPLA